MTTFKIEPATRIDGRLFDRRRDERGREPREQPKDTFTRALQEAKEAEDERQDVWLEAKIAGQT